MKIEHDLYDEIIDITRSRQYKFTMNDGRVGYFNVDYRELGSQESGDFDIRLENIHDMRWRDGSTTDDLPTLEQLGEVFGEDCIIPESEHGRVIINDWEHKPHGDADAHPLPCVTLYHGGCEYIGCLRLYKNEDGEVME